MPSSDQREKSMTHVIGFSPATHWKLAGREVVGYATGVMKSPTWTMNGTT